MKKSIAALLVMFAALLGSVAFAGSAQAQYPPTPPHHTVVIHKTVPENITAPTTLPNTGGPDGVLLAGALGLLLVGGVAVAGTRRRAAE